MHTILSDAKKIILDAIQASLPDEAVKKAICGKNFNFEGKVLVISIGKAAWNMAKAAADHIPHPIDCGIVLTKYDHSQGEIPGFTILEAGHPLPDENTILGTKKIIEAVSDLNEKDTVFFLVSGGGSALFESPAGDLTLDDFLDITDQMLKCGADIVEMNTVRKHLSSVKGGRFAELCAPAKVYCIALSDILGDRPDSIASGPACADVSTSEEAFAVIEKYGLNLNEKMKAQLKNETPKTLSNVTMEITGSVTQLCEDAVKSAESLGYTPMILTNMLNCEAKDAGKFLASIAQTIQKDNLPLKPPCAIICGGETIVRITGQGKGGRNQELALSAAESISGMDNVVIAAAGSDGTDGPTDAAGGIVDGNTKTLLSEKGISIPAILADNNSYYALKEVDSLIMTGPTGTNVNDLSLLLCK
ncbi:MAG: glycerate kinase [Anaerotignum sp.]|nr:glycerate kinase [Anaerotignum sp.]